MAGKVPENAILSHDLFEGIFARTALASDIEFFEEFPPDYDVAASRHHRWARGDWQLLPWIFHRFRAPIGIECASEFRRAGWQAIAGTTIPALGRWKLLDNLRRSLSAPATSLDAGLRLAAWRRRNRCCGQNLSWRLSPFRR